MIRMKHEKHGFHIAYNNNEVSYLENLGWVKEILEEEKKEELQKPKKIKISVNKSDES